MDIISYLIKENHRFTTNTLTTFKLEHNGHVEFCRQFLSITFSKTLFDLLSKLSYDQPLQQSYNRSFLTPRLQTWMGDDDIYASVYTKNKPEPWSPEMIMVKNKLEEITHFKFDYVLINYYRNGKDYIDYHSDKEAIGEGKNVICSISLGTNRKFVLKDEDGIKHSFIVENGSLLIMKGDATQKYWKHTIVKSKVIHSPRINLTFRHS
jgi:alkylated DNA repair dioxygenase AlkB